MNDLRDLERKICEDERTAELGVRLCERGERLFVSGQVSSAARRDEVLRMIGEEYPGRELVDELTVAEDALSLPPSAMEEIR